MKTAIHFALLFYCKTPFIFLALFRQRIHDLNFLCTNWQLEIVSVHPEHMSLHPSCAFDTQWTWPPRWRTEDQPLLHQSRLQHFIWEYQKPLSSCDMQQVLHNKRFSALNSPNQKCMHAQTDGWADGQTDTSRIRNMKTSTFIFYPLKKSNTSAQILDVTSLSLLDSTILWHMTN